MARSSGTPTAGRVHGLQDAQGEQVVGAEHGGGAVGEPEQPGARVASGGHVEPLGGQLAQALGPETGLGERVQGAGAAVADLVEAGRAADVREGAVSGVEEMPDGERAARDVVHGHRALGGALGDPVDQHEGDAVAAEGLDVAAGGVGGGEQDAPHPLFGEEGEVLGLLTHALGAVADHHAEPGVAGGPLGAARDVHEERVAHVEDEQPHDPGPPGPQLARGLAADVPEPVYRGQHAGPGLRGDGVRTVDDVGDRADGDSGGTGDVLDTHRLGHQAETSR